MPNINHFIDSRNRTLYQEIQTAGITIELIPFKKGIDHWSVNIDLISNYAKIFQGKKTNDINGFTHELLHIIQEKRGQKSIFDLTNIINFSEYSIKRVIHKELIVHINNNILHHRMIVDFENCHFKRNKFLLDYYKKPKNISKKKKDYILVYNNLIRIERLAEFLWWYFVYRFHPNTHVKNYLEQNLIKRYYSENEYLLNKLDLISIQWETELIVCNSDFINKLLIVLDNWKVQNNYH